MRNRMVKGLLILLSWSVFAITYPYIRFNGNWINNDFNHLVPKLTTVIEQRHVVNGASSGNSILYQVTVVIWHDITGIGVTRLLLHAIPFTMTIVVLMAVYYFLHRFTSHPKATIALGLVAVIPIFADLHSGGKHSVFSYSLFYLVMATSIESGVRKRAIHFVLFLSLLLFHIYISMVLLAFLLGYTILSEGAALSNANIDIRTSSSAVLAGGITWVWYIMNTPSLTFSAWLFQILPPYPTSTRTTTTGVTKAGAGIAQFIDVLTSRWEPWWVWLLLTIPLFILIIVGFLTWIWSVLSIVRTHGETYDPPFILATIAGLVGLLVVGASLGGFSATNLIFRFLVYFLPLVALLIMARPIGKWMLSSKIGVILLVGFLITGAIVAPVKTSREPAFQEKRFGIYGEGEQATLQWFVTHSDENISVSNMVVAQAILYNELAIYEEKSDLQPTLSHAPWQLRRGNPPSSESKVYSSGEWTISPVSNSSNYCTSRICRETSSSRQI